jgi:hypothetical protein
MDIISIAIGGSNINHIKKETYDLTLRYVFHFVHSISSRKISQDMEGSIFDKAFLKCALTVGYIAGLK